MAQTHFLFHRKLLSYEIKKLRFGSHCSGMEAVACATRRRRRECRKIIKLDDGAALPFVIIKNPVSSLCPE